MVAFIGKLYQHLLVGPSDPTLTLEFLPYGFRRIASNKQPYNPPAIHTSLADRIFRFGLDWVWGLLSLFIVGWQ